MFGICQAWHLAKTEIQKYMRGEVLRIKLEVNAGADISWAAFEERSFESFRSYYQYLPKGIVKMEYTIRLNNVGEFSLPPSPVEAMYAPEMFGEAPNAKIKVE
jgi:hypothetical protein